MKRILKNSHLIILIILVILLSFPSLISGIPQNGKVFLHTGHDVLWHMSVAAEVKRGLPLTYPAMNGVLLTNYHYFTDLTVGLLNLILRIPLVVVYYKILPLIFISLLVWRVYKVTFLLTNNKFTSTIATISTLISSSAAFTIPLFIGKADWQSGAFMLSPTYTQLVNPHSVLGFVVFFWGLYFVILSQKKDKYASLLKASLIFSILFAIKSFYAIPPLVAVSLISLANISFKNKSYKFLLPPVYSFAIALLIIITIMRGELFDHKSLEFRPMWLLVKMVENSNRLPLSEFILKRNHFLDTKNIVRVWIQNISLFFIFIVGNFWIKLLGIYYLLKSQWKTELKVFLLLIISISFTITLFFVPIPDNFNAMQFGRIANILVGWLFGLFIGLHFKKLYAISLLIIVGMTFFLEFSSYSTNSGLRLSVKEYESYEFIRKETPLNSIFLVDPEKGNNNPLITGLGERGTYFDDHKTTQLLGIDYIERDRLQKMFFEGGMENKKSEIFLINNDIDYIYSYKHLPEQRYNKLNIETVFKNDQVSIVKVNSLSQRQD